MARRKSRRRPGHGSPPSEGPSATSREGRAEEASLSPADEVLVAPPRGGARRCWRIGIGVVLALHLTIPLTYYLREDPYDERFAWRMFSGIRMHSCEVRVDERVGSELRPLSITETIPVAWRNLLRRNRRPVILGLLERRCEEPEVEAVVLTNRCVTPQREVLAPQVYRRECASGEVELPEEPLSADERADDEGAP